jgi:8-oxo-dGTP diphosphatase
MIEYEFPHPAVTVDCAVFGLADNELSLLLIERGEEPFAGNWALPGGFVKIEEALADAARRELQEETGVADLYLEQLGAYGAPERDPRERVITVAYLAIVNLFDHPVRAATDARSAGWFGVDDLPQLAFDHAEIVEAALERLRENVRRKPIVFEFLPDRFTFRQLQQLYESVLGHPVDKRNFRKKIQATGLVVATGDVEMDVAHRAAQLFSFDHDRYERLREDGFELGL